MAMSRDDRRRPRPTTGLPGTSPRTKRLSVASNGAVTRERCGGGWRIVRSSAKY